MSLSKKAKTRRHVDLRRRFRTELGVRKFVDQEYFGKNGTRMVMKLHSYFNTSDSVFGSPPKPRLLKDPKIGRAILIS